MAVDKRQDLLSSNNVVKSLLSFAVPAMIGLLVNALYNIIDRIFIGNHPTIGAMGIAAITASNPLTLIAMAFGIMFGVGGSTYYSICLGRGEKELAKKTLGNALVMLLIVGGFFAIFGSIFLQPLVSLFCNDPEVIPYTVEYLRWIIPGLIFMMGGMGLNSFIRADGSPKIAMWSMIIGALVNLVLDPIFIFVFDMGMAGAAIATIIGQLASMIWVWAFFMGKQANNRITWKSIALNKRVIIQMIILGISPFLMQLANSVMNLILNKSLEFYGNLSIYGSGIALAGMGVIMSLQSILLMPIMGVTQGAQPIIGYNYGSQDLHKIKETVKWALILATIIGVLGFIIAELFAPSLISMFNKDPSLIDFTSFAMRINFLLVPIISIPIVIGNYFQACGKYKTSILLTLSRQLLVLIPMVLILSYYFGLMGIVFAFPISDFISLGLSLFLFKKETKIWNSGNYFNT